MTIARFSYRSSGQPFHWIAVFLSVFAGVVFITPPAATHAQESAPSGEKVFFECGCWTCHGLDGRSGKPAPPIAKIQMPLRSFIGYVRQPNRWMPPFSPLWASDINLLTVYQWLGGIDAVRTPPLVMIDLKSSSDGRAIVQDKAEVEIEVTRAGTAVASSVPELGSLRYRVTLITNAKTPASNQILEYRLVGQEQWRKGTTDENGEALLSRDHGFTTADSSTREKQLRAQLRIALPASQTVVEIEALDYSELARPVVVGVGTTISKRR